MRKPKQVELTEGERRAFKDSHKFAKALTQPHKTQHGETGKFVQSTPYHQFDRRSR